MIPLDPPFRLAGPEDGPVLARLVDFAGEGLPAYLWSELARDGEDPWRIGAERQAQKAAASKVVVADAGGGVVAAMTGYATPAEPEPIPTDMPAIFVPLQELEALAPATWYVNVLATLAEHRGRGWGSRLLDLAERVARAEALDAMSIIVADANLRAMDLYRRSGYREAARRAMVKGGWQNSGRAWVLLVKPLAERSAGARPSLTIKNEPK